MTGHRLALHLWPTQHLPPALLAPLPVRPLLPSRPPHPPRLDPHLPPDPLPPPRTDPRNSRHAVLPPLLARQSKDHRRRALPSRRVRDSLGRADRAGRGGPPRPGRQLGGLARQHPRDDARGAQHRGGRRGERRARGDPRWLRPGGSTTATRSRGWRARRGGRGEGCARGGRDRVGREVRREGDGTERRHGAHGARDHAWRGARAGAVAVRVCRLLMQADTGVTLRAAREQLEQFRTPCARRTKPAARPAPLRRGASSARCCRPSLPAAFHPRWCRRSCRLPRLHKSSAAQPQSRPNTLALTPPHHRARLASGQA